MVSVIIPAWGETPFLERAVASVPVDAEVEVVIAKPPPEAPNSLPAARLDGVKLAKGEWILFLDADDRLGERAIEKLLAAVTDENDLVCGSLVRISRKGKRIVRRYSAIGPCEGHNSLCAKLIRRSLFSSVKSDLSIRNGEDLMVVEQLLAASRSTAVIDDIVYEYIENMMSITHRQSNESKARDLIKIDSLLVDVLKWSAYAPMHNRILRDALLLLVRARKIGSPSWYVARRSMTESVLADVRHGIVKRLVLVLACAAECFCGLKKK